MQIERLYGYFVDSGCWWKINYNTLFNLQTAVGLRPNVKNSVKANQFFHKKHQPKHCFSFSCRPIPPATITQSDTTFILQTRFMVTLAAYW